MRAKVVFIAFFLLTFTSTSFTSGSAQYELFEDFLNDPSGTERKLKKLFRKKKKEIIQEFNNDEQNNQGEEPDVAQEGEDRDAVDEKDEGPESDATAGPDVDTARYAHAKCSESVCELCNPPDQPCSPRSKLVYMGPIPDDPRERDIFVCNANASPPSVGSYRRTDKSFIRRCLEDLRARRNKKWRGWTCRRLVAPGRWGQNRRCVEKRNEKRRKFVQARKEADIWRFRVAKGTVRQAELKEIERQRQAQLAAERAERERVAWAEREREKARQEQVRKTQQEAKFTANRRAMEALRAKRDPSDVVAQVLNFTVSGRDEGTERQFWIKDRKCVYRMVQGSQFGVHADTVIDLNNLDPKNIKVGEEWSRRFQSVVSVVKYEGRILLMNLGTRDYDRVNRGWTLIYSDHCRGIQKAF